MNKRLEGKKAMVKRYRKTAINKMHCVMELDPASPDDNEETMVGLIVDILHICDEYDLCFHKIEKEAFYHYSIETDMEQEETK